MTRNLSSLCIFFRKSVKPIYNIGKYNKLNQFIDIYWNNVWSRLFWWNELNFKFYNERTVTNVNNVNNVAFEQVLISWNHGIQNTLWYLPEKNPRSSNCYSVWWHLTHAASAAILYCQFRKTCWLRQKYFYYGISVQLSRREQYGWQYHR